MPKTINLIVFFLAVAGCDSASPSLPVDAAPDVGAPDSGVACVEAADCDDGDDCTIEQCEAEVCHWTRGQLSVEPGTPVPAAQATAIYLIDDDLVIAKGEAGVEVWDLAADPPTLRWDRSPEGDERAFTRVTAEGERLYVVDGGRDVLALDRASGAPLGRFTAVNPVDAVLARGDVVFAAVGAKGIEVISFANPEAPRRIGRGDTIGRATGLSRRDQRLLVSDGLGGLTVFAIDDPASISRVGDPIPTPGRTTDTAALGPLGVMAEGSVGYSVIELGPQPQRQASNTDAPTVAVAMLGRRTAVVGGPNGVSLVSLTRPQEPTLWQALDYPDARDLIAQDGRLLVLGDAQVSHATLGCEDAEPPVQATE